MDAAAELGRNPESKHQIQPEYGDEQADAGRAAEPVSRDQILRRERGQGNIHFLCSADHEQDWQPCPVDPYSCYMCDMSVTMHSSTAVVEQSTNYLVGEADVDGLRHLARVAGIHRRRSVLQPKPTPLHHGGTSVLTQVSHLELRVNGRVNRTRNGTKRGLLA